MTNEQIAELERLNATAHPAPWTWSGNTIQSDEPVRHILAVVEDAGYNDKALMTIARNILPVLLEERRLFLATLNTIIGQVEDACINDCGICRFCVSDGVARKAIAFAKKEAR